MKKKEIKDRFRRVGNMIEYHGNRLDSLAMDASILRNRLKKLEQQIADIELMRKRIEELETLFPELADRLDRSSAANFDKWSVHEERLGKIEQQIELLRKAEEFEKAGSGE